MPDIEHTDELTSTSNEELVQPGAIEQLPDCPYCDFGDYYGCDGACMGA